MMRSSASGAETLLPGDATLSASVSDKVEIEDIEVTGSPGSRILHEAICSMKLAFPVSASAMVSYMATLIATGMIGRLGKLYLAAYTLARSFYHIVALSVIMGLACGLEIIGGQSYGARRFSLVGTTLQRAILVNTVACIPAVIMFCLGDKILKGLGQNHEIADLAWQYLIRSIPSLFAGSIFQSMLKYFSCIGQVWALALIAFVQTGFTPLWNWLFIFKLDHGLNGAAYAYNVLLTTDVFFFVIFAIILGRFIQKPGEWTWTGFSCSAFTGWWNYLQMAVPAAGMICLEWWVYEVAVMITGHQKSADANVQLSAMGLCFNLRATAFMLAQGVSVATCTRVSNLLGAGQGEQARLSMMVNTVIISVMSVVLAILIVALPEAWPRILTTDEWVIKTVADIAPYLAVGILADGIVSVGAAILRGTGRPFLGVIVTILTYWLVGLPLGTVLSVVLGLGAKGMWIALMVAAVLDAMLLTAIIAGFDMSTEIERSQYLVLAASSTAEKRSQLPHEVAT